MNRLFACLIFILSVSVCAIAQQRPLITDDVDTIPEGSFEIAAGVDFLQNAKFPLSGLRGDLTRVGDVRVKVGFSSNVEFQVEGVLQDFLAINSATNPSPIPLTINGNSTNDAGDFTISTKIKLRNETRFLPAVGFKVGFQMPNTSEGRGIGTNQINVFGKILVQKKFGKQAGKDARANLFWTINFPNTFIWFVPMPRPSLVFGS